MGARVVKTRKPRYWPSGAPRHEEPRSVDLAALAEAPGSVVVGVGPEEFEKGLTYGWQTFRKAAEGDLRTTSSVYRARSYWGQYEARALESMAGLIVAHWLRDRGLPAETKNGELTVGSQRLEVKSNSRGMDLGMLVAECGVYATRPVVLVVPRFRFEARWEAILGGWIWGREGHELAHYRTQGRTAFLYIHPEKLRPMDELVEGLSE